MKNKMVIGLIVFFGSAVLFAQTKNKHEDFTPARLGNVLHCLQVKLSALGDAPPHFDTHSFRARYAYGKLDPGDEDDELHIVVYGPGEESAMFFEVYFHGVNDKRPGMFIGEPATLKSEHGQLAVDENPGGVATFRRIEKLLRVISRRPAVTIKESQVEAGSVPCVAGP